MGVPPHLGLQHLTTPDMRTLMVVSAEGSAPESPDPKLVFNLPGLGIQRVPSGLFFLPPKVQGLPIARVGSAGSPGGREKLFTHPQHSLHDIHVSSDVHRMLVGQIPHPQDMGTRHVLGYSRAESWGKGGASLA